MVPAWENCPQYCNKEPPEKLLPKLGHRTRQPNALDFDTRPVLYGILGVDLTQIHGLGPYVALKLVAECGTEMSRWPDVTTFYFLALFSSQNSLIFQWRSGSTQVGSDHNRENGYSPGRFLSAFICPYRQGQRGNSYGT